MEYLIKSSAVIAIFYLIYKLFLQKETFFQDIRVYFLAGLAAALTIPLIRIIEFVPVHETLLSVPASAINETDPIRQGLKIDILFLLKSGYFLGVMILGTRFLIQFVSLIRFIKRSEKTASGKYRLINTRMNVSPFSFFHYIVINKESYTPEELNAILQHEQTHANQWHSIDNLLIQLFTIFLWFNPFVWLYRKDMLKNLEFIADSDVVNQPENSLRNYQYLLLKTTAPVFNGAATSSFYNSLIKNRIQMLQKEKTPPKNRYKFMFVIPLLIAFVFVFNTKVVAQKKNVQIIEVRKDDPEYSQREIITKNTSTSELEAVKKRFADKGVEFRYSKIDRNKDGEITGISISLKSKTGNTTNTSQKSNHPINPILISVNLKTGGISISSGEVASNIGDSNHGNTSSISITTKNDQDVKMHFEKKNLKKETIIIETDDASENGKKMVIYRSGKEKPLFIIDGKLIIDGKPVSEEEVNKINPDRIESISVLKGKAAIKLYGKKGENGVVEIKLK